jgi:hypothetical protein
MGSRTITLGWGAAAAGICAALDGSVGGLTVVPYGLLCTVAKSSTSSSGTTTVTRSLVAISPSGNVLWTLALD